jgi:hypothetical protein
MSRPDLRKHKEAIIKVGYDNAGLKGRILSESFPCFGQYWICVLFDGEDQPRVVPVKILELAVR